MLQRKSRWAGYVTSHPRIPNASLHKLSTLLSLFEKLAYISILLRFSKNYHYSKMRYIFHYNFINSFSAVTKKRMGFNEA